MYNTEALRTKESDVAARSVHGWPTSSEGVFCPAPRICGVQKQEGPEEGDPPAARSYFFGETGTQWIMFSLY